MLLSSIKIAKVNYHTFLCSNMLNKGSPTLFSYIRSLHKSQKNSNAYIAGFFLSNDKQLFQ